MSELNVIFSTEAIRQPLTGIGRYTLELATQLARRSDLSTTFFDGTRIIASPPSLTPPDKESRHRSDQLRRALRRWPITALTRRFGRMRSTRILRNASDQIFHGTNYSLPEFPGKCVATIHDLSVIKWPEFHPDDRVRYLEQAIHKTLNMADRVITDSEYVRQEIAEHFGWPVERIDAIHLGVSEGFHPRTERQVDAVIRHHGLRYQGYCLYSGTIEPRKNLQTLLDAYLLLPDAVRSRWPLVLNGDPGWHSEEILRRIGRYQRKGWLRYLGYLTEQDIGLILSGARAFVFPSVYEGFGLPVLEAMASGVPVACSSAGAVAEVAGDAALVFNPSDAQQMALKLEEALENDQKRSQIRESGLNRASSFSWSQCAAQTMASYTRLANG